MIARKTGALIRCSLTLGALLGTRDESAVRAFRDCGRALGYVFQIRDDVLGVWGDEEATGKPVGADIRRRKNSFPMVYAMSEATGDDKRLLLDVYGKDQVDDDDVDAVLNIMDRVRAKEYARELAAEHRDRAMEAVASVELAPHARRDLEEISDFLLARDY